MSTQRKWDLRFLELAITISNWTKDRSTAVGAVIIGQDKKPLSFGFNGIPRGLGDEAPHRHVAPQKYLYFEHAERNAIYNCDTVLKGSTIYVTHMPCADCARAIIQKRIRRVVTWDKEINSGNWNESQQAASEMFEEAGIEVTQYKDHERV